MIEIIKQDKRHFSDFGWLQTYWLFSFANYFDPHNIQFGALCVFNDDVVKPNTGFPTHPHDEMEIVTLVLSGEITHEDSTGNKTIIKAGDVQRMSAGTGLTHSEYNLSNEPVNFYQIWIYPDHNKLKPSYDQKHFDPTLWHNQLYPVASGQEFANAVSINADATIYRCNLDTGKQIGYPNCQGRRIFIYLTQGQLKVNEQQLNAKDQARIDIDDELILQADQNADFILIDIPSCKGFGYSAQTLQGEPTK